MSPFQDALREQYVMAQEQWPGVLVSLEAFEARVRRAIGTKADPSADDLARRPLADIYLARDYPA